ncbi:hypothetical protein L1049_018180 [Liquidambar formosana]|uniref:Uncharacterized protein n=1 Tax=Liquidambar formosana TaxID=63359 RepID=A0AAP0NIE0_LIQFO
MNGPIDIPTTVVAETNFGNWEELGEGVVEKNKRSSDGMVEAHGRGCFAGGSSWVCFDAFVVVCWLFFAGCVSSLVSAIYKFLFSKPYFMAFSFLITILVGVLQVNNQTNNASPFLTHPANMWAFIIATCIYSFAFAATLRLPPDSSHSLLAGFVAFFSGALSVLSIVSMFVDPLWLGWLIAILWFLLLGRVACDLFLPFFQRLFSWLMGSNAMDQQSTRQSSVPV